MIKFKSFIIEKKSPESKSGSVANANGVRHELLVAGVLSHMSKHHAGEDHPHLFNMNDSELKDHFEKHVATGNFSETHMPEHFRDNDNQTPRAVHDRHTHESLSPDEHFSHFKNAVRHAKLLHDHLEERGYDPKTLGNVAWTSTSDNVNSFMRTHGNNTNRKPNPQTDDADVMATIKDKSGKTQPVGLSLKWGSKKNADPTAKNNTHKTVLPKTNLPEEHHEAIDNYLGNAQNAISDHNKLVSGIYKGSEKTRKGQFDSDQDKLEENPNNEELKNKIQSVKDSYRNKSQKVASSLHQALKTIQSGANGHEHISNFIRQKLNIPNPDFVAVRAHMTVDNNNDSNSHHFEDHSVSLNDHLKNAHRFDIEKKPDSATVNIRAYDKDNNPLFNHTLWTKHNSRETDSTTKWLHKVRIEKQKKSKVSEAIFNIVKNICDGNLTESKINFNAIIAEKIKTILEEKRKYIFTK